jgi:two-component system response regulator
MKHRRSGILLVEDNPNDEALTCRVLKTSNVPIEVTVVRDGAEALDYIFARGQFEDRDVMDQPTVVLLERTRLMPVVIMTSSREEADLLGGYEHGANSYVVKPVKFDEFSERVRQLGLYWLLTNESLDAGTI